MESPLKFKASYLPIDWEGTIEVRNLEDVVFFSGQSPDPSLLDFPTGRVIYLNLDTLMSVLIEPDHGEPDLHKVVDFPGGTVPL